MDIKQCDVCEEQPAVVRLTAANAQGEVLDTMYVCDSSRCRTQAGQSLVIGQQSEPFKASKR